MQACSAPSSSMLPSRPAAADTACCWVMTTERGLGPAHPPFFTLPSGSISGSSGGLYSFQMFITLHAQGGRQQERVSGGGQGAAGRDPSGAGGGMMRRAVCRPVGKAPAQQGTGRHASSASLLLPAHPMPTTRQTNVPTAFSHHNLLQREGPRAKRELVPGIRQWQRWWQGGSSGSGAGSDASSSGSGAGSDASSSSSRRQLRRTHCHLIPISLHTISVMMKQKPMSRSRLRGGYEETPVEGWRVAKHGPGLHPHTAVQCKLHDTALGLDPGVPLCRSPVEVVYVLVHLHNDVLYGGGVLRVQPQDELDLRVGTAAFQAGGRGRWMGNAAPGLGQLPAARWPWQQAAGRQLESALEICRTDLRPAQSPTPGWQ